MPGFPVAGYRLMIVDDDEMAREVLALLAERAGFAVECFESGAKALERLAGGGARPSAVLADMRMPGVSGETLAGLVRGACGVGTVVLAMSATAVDAGELQGYDGFLRKPFGMAQMCSALEGAGGVEAEEARARPEVEAVTVLKTATFEEVSRAMEPGQLRELYRVYLADAEVRLRTLRAAARAGDDALWRGAAHQLKGSCGMVGAAELARLAGEMEAKGVPKAGQEAPFAELAAAMVRLRRVLAAQLP